ncbi:MAG: hypothetical protein RLZZ65_481 [Bacteroidota bacterium]|jgi:acetyltransferase-like isoleucine patch superfamily enzyme
MKLSKVKFNSKNIFISEKAKIGRNVKIGDNSIIYDNVIIEDGTIISNDCVIGEPLGDYYQDSNYQNPETKIGKNSLIRSHSIIYAGSVFGEGFSTGHRVTIREKITFGKYCRVGTLCDFQGYAQIGDYCWFHSNVHVGQKSEIGNFVFVYPYVVLTNDPTPPSEICIGPKIKDYSQIGVSSILLPGVQIGEHALVGASSVVSKDVDDYMLVIGNPAKPLKDVREIKDRITGESHYPWPYNFSRGMPWENIGYENWLSND